MGEDLKKAPGLRVLAIVGLAGTGKSQVVRHLVEERGHASVYFGSVVLDELRRRGLEGTPADERVVREDLRRDEGMEVMAARSLPRIRELLDDHHAVVIDGLYSDAERLLLQRELGSSLRLLAVHAPRWLRAERLAARPVRPLTAGQMDERDEAEVRGLDKAAPIALADLHVVNDADIATLGERVDRSIEAMDRIVDA
jgi:dephospho-CoA kinase